MELKYTWLFLLFVAVKTLAAEQLVVVGNAYAIDGSQLEYREFHYYSEDQLDHRVIYQTPDEQPVAIKVLDYRNGLTAPAFRQRGISYAEIIKVEWVGDSLEVNYQQDGKQRQKLIAAARPLVVDAGFDHFIRSHWQSLLNGETVDFNFLAVSRLSLIGLQVKKTACHYETAQDQCFQVQPSNWLISLLVDAIELGYNADTRLLSRFRGLGNISNDAGDSLKVDIHYRYTKTSQD